MLKDFLYLNTILGSLLRDQGVNVTIFEKREKNTRKRRVKLSGRILNVHITDDEIIFFSENQMKEREKAILSAKCELFTKTVGWLEMATPIKTIQEELRQYFTSSGGTIHCGEQYDISKNINLLQNYRDALVIDCTGYHSFLRDQIQPDNRITQFAEYVIVWDFKICAHFECNEMCKYYNNLNTKNYKVIPSVLDTYIDEETTNRTTQVTCLVTINKEVFDQISQQKPLTFDYINENFPEICGDMNTFLEDFSGDDIKKFPVDAMEFLALPLHVYRAKKTTHIAKENILNQTWVLMGDAALGGPYFQSISFGFEAAIYFAYIFQRMEGNVERMLMKYEDYMEKLWFTIQVRSKDIQRNKEILKALCAKDIDAILNTLKIY